MTLLSQDAEDAYRLAGVARRAGEETLANVLVKDAGTIEWTWNRTKLREAALARLASARIALALVPA